MKTLKSIFSVALVATALASCEDVPLPYEIAPEDEVPETSIYYSSAAHNTGWSTQAVGEKGNPWSQGSSYTQATGYQKWDGADSKSNREAEGFLVSPKFNTVAESGKVKFSVEYCVGYANNDKDYKSHIAIYVSKTYEDGTINLSEGWEKLNWQATFTSTDWSLTTEEIQLPDEYVNQPNVHLAYWFYAPASGSATFEVKQFVIEEGVVGEQGGNEGGNDNPEVGVSSVPYTSASLQEGWKVWAASGKNNPWSQGANYTQATGYQKWEGDSKSNREVDGYLISPAFNTTVASGKVKMAFDNCVAYVNNDPDYAKHIKLYISKTADGSNFDASQWEQLDWTATHESSNWTLTTDEVQLPEAYVNQENVHVAFWFYAPAEKSSTFELKTFKLLEGEAGQSTPNDGEGGGTPDTGDADLVIQASALGLDNAAEVNGVSYQGFTFAADGGGNQNTPKYYTSGSAIRMYPKNTLTVTADKSVEKVVLTCVSGSVANGNVGSTPGTVEVKDPTVTISGINANSFTIENKDGSTGAASQIRIVSIAVYYAK